MSNFTISDKVVCVDDKDCLGGLEWNSSLPVEGHIYVIRGVFHWVETGVWLVGISGRFNPRSGSEQGFKASRFRRLSELKTHAEENLKQTQNKLLTSTKCAWIMHIVGACCKTGMDKHDHSDYLSKPLRRIQQRIRVCRLSNLLAPERRFCVLASASSGDRDCVGPLARGTQGPTRNLPALSEGKRRGSGVLAFWFSFAFDRFFSRGTFYRLQGGTPLGGFGGFFFIFRFLLHSLSGQLGTGTVQR